MPLPLLALLGLIGAGTAGAGSAIGAARRSGKPRNPLEDDPNASVVDQPGGGAFSSFLESAGKPAEAVNDLLVGNFAGAGRRSVDFLGDILDSVLPGDVIPQISQRRDKPQFSDVVGGIEPGIGKFAVDVLGGAATDPTTFLPGSLIAKTGRGIKAAAGAGISAIDTLAPGFEQGAKQTAASIGHGVRSTFAALKPLGDIAKAERAGSAVGKTTQRAAAEAAVAINEPFSRDIQRKARLLLEDAVERDGKIVKLGVEPVSSLGNRETQLGLIEQRLAKAGFDPKTTESVRSAVTQNSDFYRALYGQAIADKVFTRPDVFFKGNTLIPKQQLDDLFEKSGKAGFKGGFKDFIDQQGIRNVPLPKGFAPLDFAPRQLGIDEDFVNSLKSRTLDRKEFIDKLNEPGVIIEDNLGKIGADYAATLGRASKASTTASQFLGAQFKSLVDPESKQALNSAISGLRAAGDLDSAAVLETATKGLPPRGAVSEWLASRNKPFKAAATAGVLVPRLNFTVGNVTSSVWQTLSNAEARGQTWQAAKRVIPTIITSIGDGLQSMGIGKMGFTQAREVSLAAKASGGTRAGMLRNLRDPVLRSAVQHGVLDAGFVGSEQLLASAAEQAKGAKSFRNWLYMPQAIARSSEQQMRFGLFKDLLPKHGGAEAARITNDALLDYNISSASNRTARDIIPFFQFTAKTIPQQAGFLAEQPSVIGAISRAANRPEDQPVFPFQEGKLNIPLGQNQQGDNQFISSLRLPFETLTAIPDVSNDLRPLGRSLGQQVIGASTPPIKSALGLAFGRDPFFDTPFGGFSKLPGNIEAGAAGRAFNILAGTGLIQPIASTANTIGNAIDDRTTPAQKAINLLTGAKVVNVDPDLAIQQQITQRLEQNPEVRQIRTFLPGAPSEETDRLLEQLRTIRQRVKATRNAVAQAQ